MSDDLREISRNEMNAARTAFLQAIFEYYDKDATMPIAALLDGPWYTALHAARDARLMLTAEDRRKSGRQE